MPSERTSDRGNPSVLGISAVLVQSDIVDRLRAAPSSAGAIAISSSPVRWSRSIWKGVVSTSVWALVFHQTVDDVTFEQDVTACVYLLGDALVGRVVQQHPVALIIDGLAVEIAEGDLPLGRPGDAAGADRPDAGPSPADMAALAQRATSPLSALARAKLTEVCRAVGDPPATSAAAALAANRALAPSEHAACRAALDLQRARQDTATLRRCDAEIRAAAPVRS